MSEATERSKPHRRVEELLDEMAIAYQSEYSFPPYKIDIFLPEWWCAIEIDGPAHLRKRDQKRDEVLKEEYGLLIMRIKTSGSFSKANLRGYIVPFIEKAFETAEARKERWLTRR